MIRWFLGISTVMMSAASFAACGGGSTSSSTPASSTSGANTHAASTTTPSSGSGSSDLKAAIAKLQGATFRADYTTTLGSAGTQALTDAKMTIIMDGANGLRVDLSGKQNGNDVSLTIIDAGSTSVVCLKGVQLGSADAAGACLKSSAVRTNPGAGIKNALQRFEASDVTVLDKSQRTIAGKDATCYQTQKAGETTTTTVCIDGNGVLLYGKTDGSANEITATDVSGSVSSSDFNPPYAVRDLPGVPTSQATTPAGQ